MSADRMEAIKARAAQAPGGRWYVERDVSVWVDDYPVSDFISRSGLTGPFPIWAEGAAEFIAHSRADVDWLVARLEAVQRIANYWATLAPGDQHYAREIATALKGDSDD